MTKLKSSEKINVVRIDADGTDFGDRFEYDVKAELIHDYNKTPAHENVAWNGVLLLYQDKNDNLYLWHSSGRSDDRGYAKKVPEKYKDEVHEMSVEEAMEVYQIYYS